MTHVICHFTFMLLCFAALCGSTTHWWVPPLGRAAVKKHMMVFLRWSWRIGFTVITSKPWRGFTWAILAISANQRWAICVSLATAIWWAIWLVIRSPEFPRWLRTRGQSERYLGDKFQISLRFGCQPVDFFCTWLDSIRDPPSGQRSGKKTVPRYVGRRLTNIRKVVAQTVWVGNFSTARWASIPLFISCNVWSLPFR